MHMAAIGKAMPRPRLSCCDVVRPVVAAAGSGEKEAALLMVTVLASVRGVPMAAIHAADVKPHMGAHAAVERGKEAVVAAATAAATCAAPDADDETPMLTATEAQDAVATDCRTRRGSGCAPPVPSSARRAAGHTVTALAASMAAARMAEELVLKLICAPPGMYTALSATPTSAA